MAGRRSTFLFFISLYLNVGVVLLYHSEDSSGGTGICSNENEAQSYLKQINAKCFNISLPSHYSNWKLCDDEEHFTCRHLIKYISVIPSCGLCNSLHGFARVQCFRDQLDAVGCTLNNMVVPTIKKTFTCEKVRGHCELGRSSVPYDKMTPVTRTSAPMTSTANPTTSSSKASVGIFDAHYGRRGKKCEQEKEQCKPCDGEAAAVSVAGAVGLFFAGLVLGTLIACCVCLFTPSLQRKFSEKVLRKLKCVGRDGTQPTAQQSQTSVTSAYSDPMVSDTYDAPHDRASQPSSVNSPTYQVPMDDMILGLTNGTSRANQSPSANQIVDHDYDYTEQPITDADRPTNDYNTLMHNANRTSHEYKTLVHNVTGEGNEGVDGNQNGRGSDLAEHQYFVLEQQGGNGMGSRSLQGQGHQHEVTKDNTYEPNHNYFVLEKQKR